MNNFDIYLGKLSSFLDENNSNNIDNTHISHIEAIPNSYLSIRGYHVLHEYHSDNRSYLFFFKSRCEISKVSDIYRDINCLYHDSEIILQPKKEGRFTFRLLEIDPHNKSLVPKEVKFSIRKIEHEDYEKLILEDYNDDDISINYYGLQCMYCTVSPLINIKENRQFFSDAYKNCGRYFHQYKLNYFNPDDAEFKNPLQLKTDFFIFDYKEYCQQTYLQECYESKRDFYEYIESLFFDIKELENIFIDDFEDDEVLNDPLGYMEHKCIYLLKKYKNFDEDKRVIMAYLITINIDIPYSELHDIFFPSKTDRDSSQKTTNFNKYLRKFEKIAEKNNIPYVRASKFRKIDTMEGNREIKNILKEQLAAIRAKKREKPKP